LFAKEIHAPGKACVFIEMEALYLFRVNLFIGLNGFHALLVFGIVQNIEARWQGSIGFDETLKVFDHFLRFLIKDGQDSQVWELQFKCRLVFVHFLEALKTECEQSNVADHTVGNLGIGYEL